jgi:16S rRNA (uracil1498-N3)-methyltransferase
MPRFYVPQPQIENGMLRVEGNEVRHIRRVLRLKVGDEIVVFNGSAKEYEGKIVEEGPSSVVIMIQSILSSKRESPLEITLAQSLLKGEKMDYIIQKATELGIKEIIPFFSSRSVPLLEKSRRLPLRLLNNAEGECFPKLTPSKTILRCSKTFLRTFFVSSFGRRKEQG